MLPDIASTKRDIHTQLMLYLQIYIRQKDPVLRQIKGFVQHEGAEHRYERVGFEPVREGYSEMGSELRVEMSEIPELIGEPLLAKLRSVGDKLIKQQAAMFYRKVGESAALAGNVFDADGGPMTPDLLLDMIERIETDFDSEGKPTNAFVLHPDSAPRFQAIAEKIENDPKLKARSDAIRNRQLEQWLVRENNRKLAD